MKLLKNSLLLGLLLFPVLLISCGDKKEKAAEELESSGYQPTPQDFLRAAENGDVRVLGLFIKQGTDLNTTDDNGWTALHLAARAKRQESIAFLLESGMAVDTLGLDGVTPLMLAAREGNTTMVRYLLKQGAKAELRDEKKRSALILAVEGDHKACVEELAPYSRAQLDTALLYAASKGKHQVIETLSSFGASVYVRHDGGMTPLMLAAKYGYLDTIHSLLETGANRYAVNENGWTAAQVAAEAGHDQIAAMLGQSPEESELAITESEDIEEVTWERPVEFLEDVEIAETSSSETEQGENPEKTDTTTASAPVSDSGTSGSEKPVVSAGESQTSERVREKVSLPFVEGKKIVSKASTPSEVVKEIAMVDYRAKPLPIMVEKTNSSSSDGGHKAELRMLYGQQKKVEVAVGDMIPETQFKIVNIRRMLNHSKITDGQPTDVSVVEIEDTRTGKRRKMTARIPAWASEPWAVMKTKSNGEYYAVRPGQSFSTEDGQRFTVTDVRPTQLVITNHGTGKVSTIPLGR